MRDHIEGLLNFIAKEANKSEMVFTEDEVEPVTVSRRALEARRKAEVARQRGRLLSKPTVRNKMGFVDDPKEQERVGRVVLEDRIREAGRAYSARRKADEARLKGQRAGYGVAANASFRVADKTAPQKMKLKPKNQGSFAKSLFPEERREANALYKDRTPEGRKRFRAYVRDKTRRGRNLDMTFTKDEVAPKGNTPIASR